MSTRPHCKAPGACAAKSLQRHCRSCAMSAICRRVWASPEYRARKRVSARTEQLRTPEAQAKRVAGIRAARAVWPDCPPDLASDYANLRRYFTAVDARAMLDPAYAAGRVA